MTIRSEEEDTMRFVQLILGILVIIFVLYNFYFYLLFLY